MNEKTLGGIIAEKRKALGMTQLDLAQKMDVTDKAVSKWERDLSCPDIHSLPRLAEILGMTVDELMQTNGPKPRTDITPYVEMATKAVTLAMGVAVAVLSAMGKLDVQSGMGLLGIGLACAGTSLFCKK